MSSATQNDTDYDLEDISSFSSQDSYKPQPFRGPSDSHVGEAISRKSTNVSNGTHMDDTHSRNSESTLKKMNSNAVERVVTHNALAGNSETIESLREKGLDLEKKAVPDFNAPLTTSGTQQFPEEYRLETDTGLVKMKTLETLKRKSTQASDSSRQSKRQSPVQSQAQDEDQGQDDTMKKINMAVERNKKQLEKYQKHKKEKGVKGFFHRLFD